jgi:hypothetical protein
MSARVAKKDVFLFIASPTGYAAFGSPEEIAFLKAESRRGACWFRFNCFQESIQIVKEKSGVKNIIVIIVNLNNIAGQKVKNKFFNREQLFAAEQEGRDLISVAFEKKKFLELLPFSANTLKRNINAQLGLPVLVVDMVLLRYFLHEFIILKKIKPVFYR